jgi:hypothetical protein
MCGSGPTQSFTASTADWPALDTRHATRSGFKETTMAYAPHDDFRSLYDAYTGPGSTAQHLTKHMVRLTEREPLLLVTGADFVIFPGSGRAPIVESFRHSTRGFVELTAVSHLAPGIAWVFRLRELGFANWRDEAKRIIERSERVRGVNDARYWATQVAVEAYRGYEEKIADMVDYTCRVSSQFMKTCLADERLMTFENLRQNFLDPIDNPAVPVPLNDVMVATFTLTFLDIAHRMIRWLRSQDLNWRSLMVLLSGKSGRPSAGLTWQTNNNCHLLWRASEERIAPENVQITPHGPTLALSDLREPARIAQIEGQVREVFLQLRANTDLAREMFEGYPAFAKSIEESPVIESTTKSLQAMPRLRSPDDRFTSITLLRFVMEDSTQLLSNSVAHSVIDQLCEHNNQPERVLIPGFSKVAYPTREAGKHAVG